jgi:putative SOS response-associated peptidase YedK
MCGRFTREFTWREVHDFLDLRFPAPAGGLAEMPRSWNVAPTQMTPVLMRDGSGARQLVAMSWGLRPAWATDPSRAPINARSETVSGSAMFRGAFKSRRCLIPASGFYEWRNDSGKKQPFYIRLLNDPTFCFGGIYEPGVGDSAPTFATLTTRPNELMATIHDRMPVIIRRERFDAWLQAADSGLQDFEPFAAEEMSAWTVGQRVGNPRNNDAELVKPAASEGLFG